MMTHQQKKWLCVAVALLLFALLKVSLLLWWQARQTAAQIIPPCAMTQTACTFGASGKVQLLGVGDAKTPFRIRITGVPQHTRNIHASFYMRDMEMGFNKFNLQKQSDGSWQADNVHLPLCSQMRHDWIMEWTVDQHTFQAAFQTETVAH